MFGSPFPSLILLLLVSASQSDNYVTNFIPLHCLPPFTIPLRQAAYSMTLRHVKPQPKIRYTSFRPLNKPHRVNNSLLPFHHVDRSMEESRVVMLATNEDKSTTNGVKLAPEPPSIFDREFAKIEAYANQKLAQHEREKEPKVPDDDDDHESRTEKDPEWDDDEDDDDMNDDDDDKDDSEENDHKDGKIEERDRRVKGRERKKYLRVGTTKGKEKKNNSSQEAGKKKDEDKKARRNDGIDNKQDKMHQRKSNLIDTTPNSILPTPFLTTPLPVPERRDQEDFPFPSFINQAGNETSSSITANRSPDSRSDPIPSINSTRNEEMQSSPSRRKLNDRSHSDRDPLDRSYRKSFLPDENEEDDDDDEGDTYHEARRRNRKEKKRRKGASSHGKRRKNRKKKRRRHHHQHHHNHEGRGIIHPEDDPDLQREVGHQDEGRRQQRLKKKGSQLSKRRKKKNRRPSRRQKGHQKRKGHQQRRKRLHGHRKKKQESQRHKTRKKKKKRKPKKVSKGYVYIKKSPKIGKGPNSYQVSEFEAGNYQSFEDDFDSKRDTPKKKKKRRKKKKEDHEDWRVKRSIQDDISHKLSEILSRHPLTTSSHQSVNSSSIRKKDPLLPLSSFTYYSPPPNPLPIQSSSTSSRHGSNFKVDSSSSPLMVPASVPLGTTKKTEEKKKEDPPSNEEEGFIHPTRHPSPSRGLNPASFVVSPGIHPPTHFSSSLQELEEKARTKSSRLGPYDTHPNDYNHQEQTDKEDPKEQSHEDHENFHHHKHSHQFEEHFEPHHQEFNAYEGEKEHEKGVHDESHDDNKFDGRKREKDYLKGHHLEKDRHTKKFKGHKRQKTKGIEKDTENSYEKTFGDGDKKLHSDKEDTDKERWSKELGKLGFEWFKDKGHKKHGWKNVYHKEEWGDSKKYQDVYQDKDWKKKWSKWDQEKDQKKEHSHKRIKMKKKKDKKHKSKSVNKNFGKKKKDTKHDSEGLSTKKKKKKGKEKKIHGTTKDKFDPVIGYWDSNPSVGAKIHGGHLNADVTRNLRKGRGRLSPLYTATKTRHPIRKHKTRKKMTKCLVKNPPPSRPHHRHHAKSSSCKGRCPLTSEKELLQDNEKRGRKRKFKSSPPLSSVKGKDIIKTGHQQEERTKSKQLTQKTSKRRPSQSCPVEKSTLSSPEDDEVDSGDDDAGHDESDGDGPDDDGHDDDSGEDDSDDDDDRQDSDNSRNVQKDYNKQTSTSGYPNTYSYPSYTYPYPGYNNYGYQASQPTYSSPTSFQHSFMGSYHSPSMIQARPYLPIPPFPYQLLPSSSSSFYSAYPCHNRGLFSTTSCR